MKTFTLALLLLSAFPAYLCAADPPAAEGFKAFRHLRVRNIFDPSRRNDPPMENAARPVTTTAVASRPQFVALTGTMLREGKSLGFFSGSGSDGNRVVGVGETVAGYRVRGLTLAGAELEKEGKSVTLPVGRQMSLDGSHAGAINDFTPEPSAPPPPSFASTTTPNSPSASGPSSPSNGSYRSSDGRSSDRRESRDGRSDDRDRDRDRDRDKGDHQKKSTDEILRKLMEKRQKENSK